MKNYQTLLSEIKKGHFQPVYFLTGDEPYFIDQLAHAIQEFALREEERSFNEVVLYGKETEAQTIAGEARRYPMMADRVLVIVREAQDLRNYDAIEAYLENPQTSTVLVFSHKYKKVDKRKKFYKTLQKQGWVFESKKLYDNQLPDWIKQHCQHLGFGITPKANQLMLESLGNDLSKIDNELNKLALILPKRTEINDAIIEENIGISKDFNNFELQKALINRDFATAINIQKYFAANPKLHPLVLTLGLLYSFFSKLMIAHQAKDKTDAGLARTLKINPYFTRDYKTGMRNYNIKKCAQAISDLRECDRMSKGVENATTPDGELLKELLYKIICT